MKIVFIGTGSCNLDRSRAMTCIALQGERGVYLLDAGSGAVHSCIQYGIELEDIKGVFITHFHVDHVLDVVQLLWLRHVHRHSMISPLLIAGPPGTARFLSSLQHAFGSSVAVDSALTDTKEIPPGKEIRTGELILKAFKSIHTDESICYRVSTKEKHVAYSGDGGIGKDLIEACREADLAVLECSYGGPSPIPTHMGPQECASVGRQSKAKRLVLTHLPAGIDPAALARIVEKDYRGPCTIAQDFMEVSL